MATARTRVEQIVRRTPLWAFAKQFLRWVLQVLRMVGFHQSEERLAGDAQAFWEGDPVGHDAGMRHLRDGLSGEAWQRIGALHRSMVERDLAAEGRSAAGLHLVEWGCGGGLNAVALGSLADRITGVDLADSTLDHCSREMARAHPDLPFEGVRITVDDPAASLQRISRPVDLLVCTYVMELVPSPSYGAQLLEVFAELLAPDGIGLVQFKYRTGRRDRRGGLLYRLQPASMTTYRLEELWEVCDAAGLEPQHIRLLPWEPLVDDGPYAYVTVRGRPSPPPRPETGGRQAGQEAGQAG